MSLSLKDGRGLGTCQLQAGSGVAGPVTTFRQPGHVFQFRLFSLIIFSKSLSHASTG